MPTTRYARTKDGVNIAYQVVGDGPIDLVLAHAWISHVEIYCGLVFEDAGEHELKGVPDRWRLYRVVG
jgi:hypothetical protein